MAAPWQVLIAEDDWIIAQGLRDDLESLNCRVVGIAATGVQALAVAAEQHVDVAVMDIGLADALDGTTVGERLADSGIAVIYVTGQFDRALMEGRGHAVDLLAKPLQRQDLERALKRAHRQRSLS